MNDTPSSKLSREQRLALKLRENLRRRKAQARAKHESGVGAQSSDEEARGD